MYVVNWQKPDVEFSRGIHKLLGYSKEEFTLELVLSCVHPDDIDVLSRIFRGVMNLAINNDIIMQKQYLNVIFRMLKKEGTYLRVMRQSIPYQTDGNLGLITHLSLLTDMSFIKSKTNVVEWEIFADNLDVLKFKQSIYKEFDTFFTLREKEIIGLINKDFTNKKIAEQLFISAHTVVAHRKNILKKSNCHNTKELLEFCEHNGIIL